MNALFHLIEKAYQLRVKRYKIIHNREKSFVIKLYTNRGTFLGKSLNNNESRQSFIQAAESHLRHRGISIPTVLSTNQQRKFVTWKGRPLVLQKWAHGRECKLNSNVQLRRIAAALGKMHRVSRGFDCNAAEYNGAMNWNDEYQKDIDYMQKWYKRYSRSRHPKIRKILPHLRFFIKSGKIAYRLLGQNHYFPTWSNLPLSSHFLCHGDYHLKNLLERKRKITFIDWEDVRFDFPSKDISRLLFGVMEHDKIWSPKRFKVLISAYLKHNPLTRQQLALLYNDLAFPHLFERMLRKKIYSRYSTQSLQKIIRSERKKTTYMLRKAKLLV